MNGDPVPLASNTMDDYPADVVALCTAYESGFGDGVAGLSKKNPYTPWSSAWFAWSYGVRCGQAKRRPDETTAHPQAPIARIKIKADRCYAVELYAPGLPPGEHDLYCETEAVAPMMREKRAYYETHDPPHCPTCGCGIPSEKATGESHGR